MSRRSARRSSRSTHHCDPQPATHGHLDCPAGDARDEVSRDDAAWLDAHPDARWRYRPITDAERICLAGAGATIAATATVIVTRVAPGVRRVQYMGVTA